jgi:hypothetical protein
VELHIVRCSACRSRLESFEYVSQQFRDGSAAGGPEWPATIARLRARLAGELRDRAARRGEGRLGRLAGWPAVAALAIVIVGLAAAIVMRGPATRKAAGRAEVAALPVPALTPGATAAVSEAEICAGSVPEPGAVAESVRRRVLAAYRMTEVSPAEYELDYLITPELGGANDYRNLWPQPYASPVWNAHVKDQLEDLLPQLVCSHRLDLATAQRDIAANWIAAYKKYFHTTRPLRVSASVPEVTLAALIGPRPLR